MTDIESYNNGVTEFTVTEGGHFVANSGVLYNDDTSTLINYPRNKTSQTFVIPDGVINVASGAFQGQRNLTSLTFPDSVETIAPDQSGMPSLEALIFGNGITSIDADTFYNNENLTSVTLPDSLTAINAFAFIDNPLLTSITIPSTLASLASNAFDLGQFTAINYFGGNGDIYATLKTFMATCRAVNNVEPGYVASGPGTLDTTFGDGGCSLFRPYGGGVPNSAAFTRDGLGIISAGVKYAPSTQVILTKHNLDGTLDESFGEDGISIPGIDGVINSIAIDSEERIVAAVISYEASTEFMIARFTPDGIPDTTFGEGGVIHLDVDPAYTFQQSVAVTIGTDDSIIVGGETAGDGSSPAFTLVKYDNEGVRDLTFGESGTARTQAGTLSYLTSLALDRDNKIVVAGSWRTTESGEFSVAAIARYNLDGSLDSSFGDSGTVTTSFPGNNFYPGAMKIDNANNIVIVGVKDGSPWEMAVMRYTPNGTLDETFGSSGQAIRVLDPYPYFYSIAIDDKENIYTTGYVGSALGAYKVVLARVTSSGEYDSTFGDEGLTFTQITNTDPVHQVEEGAWVGLDSSGRIFVVGRSWNDDPVNAMFGLLRYSNSDAPAGGGDDGSAALATATAAVVTAESSDTQSDLNAASTLVNALPSSESKTALLARIVAQQAVIDAASSGSGGGPTGGGGNSGESAAAARAAAAAAAAASAAAAAATKEVEKFLAPQSTSSTQAAKPAPTIATYIAAGITGVNKTNLDLVNALVKELDPTVPVTAKALVEVVKVATTTIAISTITSTAKVIRAADLATVGVTTIATKELRAFTAFIASLPAESRDTPAEIAKAAEAFKVKVAADAQAAKDARAAKLAAQKAALAEKLKKLRA